MRGVRQLYIYICHHDKIRSLSVGLHEYLAFLLLKLYCSDSQFTAAQVICRLLFHFTALTLRPVCSCVCVYTALTHTDTRHTLARKNTFVIEPTYETCNSKTTQAAVFSLPVQGVKHVTTRNVWTGHMFTVSLASTSSCSISTHFLPLFLLPFSFSCCSLSYIDSGQEAVNQTAD